MQRVRALIVDDSALIRNILRSILESDPAIEVIGEAEDPYDAREKIKRLKPDVITLDIEMPRMDGITFLKNIMRLRPLPVLMISTLTEQGAEITIKALELGAIDFIAKPKMNPDEGMLSMAGIICAKVKFAARARVGVIDQLVQGNAPIQKRSLNAKNFSSTALDLIVIGASTGGTTALKQVLKALPAKMPPIAIVQHMPEAFTASFAYRLDRESDLTVSEFSQDNTKLECGHVYVAKGSTHMAIERRGSQLIGRIDSSPPVNRHKPSVDVLFNSVSGWADSRVLAVLLTGMGADGAMGMGALKDRGGITVAQDESSSVVWGMPRVAIENGVVDHVLPLGDVASCLINYCYKQQAA
jgi:two-component system chemotaxis response regulator CheB